MDSRRRSVIDMKGTVLFALLLGAGCAHHTPAPVPVPPQTTLKSVVAKPVTGVMVQIVVYLDDIRIYPSVEILPDGHNTFILTYSASRGPHVLAITSIDVDGNAVVEPVQMVVN